MEHCNLKICNARVIDGSNGPAVKQDVAIEGDCIVATGDLSAWYGDEHIDAGGQVLAPGFIDVHTHDDLALLKTPDIPFKTSQGVTTVVAGNCGISLAPFASGNGFPAPFPLLGGEREFVFPTVEHYRQQFEKQPASVNVALLAGHSSLRVSVLGEAVERPAEQAEIEQMKDSLLLALKQGAIGLSTGLDYPPAAKASTREIVELASMLPGFKDALYVTHMRNEGDHVVEAVSETLEIGSRAGTPVVISHHKCAGPKNYGRSVETLKMISEAQHKQQVMLDVYPYTASSTTLIPRFIRDAEAVLVAHSDPYPEHSGKMLTDIAGQWQCSVEEAAQRLYPAAAIYFQMDEGDLQRIMRFPSTMIGSDGLSGMAKPHPRLWGTFPRVLGRYVREKKLLSIENAIHKMTGLSAQTYGLARRGLIKPGYYADLVLFDPALIEDRASFEKPDQMASGIDRVFVNGKSVWKDRQSTPERPGQFLTH